MSAAGAHHRLHVEADLGSLHLNARLEFAAPWTVIFGPSGSGKSSLLRAMCGLLRARQLEFAARSPGTTGTNAGWTEIEGPRHRTPPHLRGLAYAPQGAVIFPHLTVRENVAFALQNRRKPASPRTNTGDNSEIALSIAPAEEAIELFNLAALAGRMPRDLSGGERQRVNLARAFAVPQPRWMLLDEPFNGTDRATRDALLPRMKQRLLALGIPAISVTHDVEEALLLGAEVIRIEAGKAIAQGPALQVLAAEREQMLRALQAGAANSA